MNIIQHSSLGLFLDKHPLTARRHVLFSQTNNSAPSIQVGYTRPGKQLADLMRALQNRLEMLIDSDMTRGIKTTYKGMTKT